MSSHLGEVVMAKAGRIKAIEQEHGGIPFDELVMDLLNNMGSIPPVARKLGISETGLAKWLKAHGISKKIIWHKAPAGKSRNTRKPSMRAVQTA